MALAKLKSPSPCSPEEYLRFEREAETRHEFLDGEIYRLLEIYERVEFVAAETETFEEA